MIMRSVLCSCLLTLWVPPAAAAPLIMLDPGHGGTNTGAQGADGRFVEKRLTLALAFSIQSYLQQWVPGARIALTRGRDEYLTLDQRKRRVNAAGAALFVSLHYNASESHGQRGYETFILSRQASDDEAARLAYRENQGEVAVAVSRKSSAAEGDPAASSKQMITGILADLRQTATHAASARLAHALQKALHRVHGPDHDRGVRQAPFDVLMGLRMPAALVEVGFIDHPIEGPELCRPAMLEQVAASLADSIAEFLAASEERRLARSTILSAGDR